MTIIAAADGSALGNPGPAGWAWYMDDANWGAGGWAHGTNNMGELMAVLDLLRATAVRADEPLKILCDSQYVINSVTKWMKGWKKKGWKKSDGKPVLNLELLKDIDAALVGRDVSFEWVKGHAGHPLNEAADDRARGAATAYQAGKAPDAGPGFAAGGASVPDAGGSGPARGAGSAGGASAAGAASTSASRASGAAGARGERTTSGISAEDPAEALPGLDDAAGVSTPVEIALTLEAEVMDAVERQDPETLRFLLSPGFRGVGAAGELLDVASLAAAEAGRPTVDGVERLAEDAMGEVVQLAYRVHRGPQASIVTSWWRRERSRWRCFFRQETPQL